ncbi:transposase domain-containing protein [Psychromonas sp. MME2]|uniref:transposase domain-containing protein n=1 Tax=unclassified Psychromonas TaxID=2614957 RepID=UPI00339C5928
MKYWFSATELCEVPNLPSTVQNINAKANKEQWQSRPRSGQGGGKEFHIDSLPTETRAHLMLQASQIEVNGTVFDLPKKDSSELSYCPEALWYSYEKATSKHKEKAQHKFTIACAVADLRSQNIPIKNALEMVAEKFESSVGTVRRTFYTVDGYERCDWITLFVPKYKARKAALDAEFTPEAWEFLKADYLRLEQPCLTTSIERTIIAGEDKGWVVPSESSIIRKIKREITKDEIVLLREGEHALMSLYPSQRRTVLNMHAMEHINGDGYQHNVFVRWHNGEIVRPKTWFWQDIYSRKIVGYYTDISENTDSIRLALMSVIEQYGIPKEVTIDNTRAAANKKMTGGVKNRYRFKVKEDDPKGIIPLLGIKLHWTSINYGKGHGQAKPIERAFGVGGLEEMIDKHPLNAGGYTGANPMAKPDNYGSKAIAVDAFLQSVEAGVAQFNARAKRETEVCMGLSSFNEVFDVSYQASQIKKATKEQLRLLMLTAESVTLQKDGSFTLQSGGTIANRKNRYSNLELIGMQLKSNKLEIRFDPRNLHKSVLCYSLDGRFICEAECIDMAGFNDTSAAREQHRHRTQYTKATKKAAQAQQKMDIAEVAAQMPAIEPPPPPETKIVEMFQQVGNTLRKQQVEVDEREDAFCRAMDLIQLGDEI